MTSDPVDRQDSQDRALAPAPFMVRLLSMLALLRRSPSTTSVDEKFSVPKPEPGPGEAGSRRGSDKESIRWITADGELRLEAIIGDFGKHQLRQYLLHILGAFATGIHMFSVTVVAPTPDHRCFIDELDGAVDHPSYGYFNESILSEYIPYDKKGDELDSCKRYSPGAGDVISCTKFLYDTSTYKTSRVIEFDLVCDQRWQRAIIQTAYMFGVLIGALVLGSLADKLGRKTIFCVSGVGQLVFGLAGPFITNLTAYCVTLFFYGMFGSGGASVTGFVLSMELIGESKRTICGTITNVTFAVAVMLVALWSFLITDVKLLQIILALHSLLLIPHWWFMDESIAWLWGIGRRKEAVRLIEKAVKINGRPQAVKDLQKGMQAVNANVQNSLDCESETPSISSMDEKTYGAVDLFKKPVLRYRTITMALLWFTNSLVYYGLSLNTGSLGGNPHLVLFLIALVELPGYFAVIKFLDIAGRRSMESSMLLVGGAMCIVVAFLSPGAVATTLVMIGKMAITGSFSIVYNYTAELFPTVVRNSAIGVGASSARFSGMLTPLIGLLDSVGNEVPTLIFGGAAVLAAVLTLILPETLNTLLPQTMEDGERLGVGDTGFKACFDCMRGKKREAPVHRATVTTETESI